MAFLCCRILVDVFSSPLRLQRADWFCRLALCDCWGLFKVILFAALSKFCEMAVMTIYAWVLAALSNALGEIQTAASSCQSTVQYGNGILKSVC